VPVKIEAVLRRWTASKEERCSSASRCCARPAPLARGRPGRGDHVNTDGLTVTFTLAPVDPKDRSVPRAARRASRLVRGFAQVRCGGKVEFRDEDGSAPCSSR